MTRLQQKFSKAASIMMRDRSAISIFAVENLEKLLSAQYHNEKDQEFNFWLKKMNDLDFHNRTRTFFLKFAANTL